MAGGLAVVLAASLVVAVESPAASAAPALSPAITSQAPATVTCPPDRPDVASAAVAARLCGGRVEVLNARSETSQTWVNSDGTLTAEQHLAPVRLRRGDAWVPVDVSLAVAADGSVAAKAHPNGLRLSGAKPAGDNAVVSLGSGDELVASGWSGALPAPVVAGTRATYPEVLPWVDLVIEATRTGYKQLWVVKDRAGLAQVGSIAQWLRAPKLTVAADGAGGVVLTDAKGVVRGRSPAPLMWDSAVDPQSLEHLTPRAGGVDADPTRRGPGGAGVDPGCGVYGPRRSGVSGIYRPASHPVAVV